MTADVGGGLAIAYVGLGANLDDPQRQVERAIAELAMLPDSRLVGASTLYRTAPVGPGAQPDYVNAAARLLTRLDPVALLTALQGIERAHGRMRDGTRWGPRTLDLDLLLYGDLRCDLPGLNLPHPELHRRAFVLVPLLDVAPSDLTVPGQGRLADLARALPQSDIVPLPTGVGGLPGASAQAALS